MARTLVGFFSAVALFTAPLAVSAQALQPAKPEEAGMSAQRLAKIADVFNAEIKDAKIPGAVIMIARRGKVVYHEALSRFAEAGPRM